MTSTTNAIGMLSLAGLLLATSAYCLGLPTRWLRRLALSLSLVAALPAVALAQMSGVQGASRQQGPGGAGHAPPPGPPPEAVAACQGRASGAACSFTDHGGNTRTGLCSVAQMHGQGGMSSASSSSTTTSSLACGPTGMGGPPSGTAQGAPRS